MSSCQILNAHNDTNTFLLRLNSTNYSFIHPVYFQAMTYNESYTQSDKSTLWSYNDVQFVVNCLLVPREFACDKNM